MSERTRWSDSTLAWVATRASIAAEMAMSGLGEAIPPSTESASSLRSWSSRRGFLPLGTRLGSGVCVGFGGIFGFDFVAKAFWMNRTDTCFSKGDATPRQEAEQRPCAAPSAAAASNPTGPDSQLSRMLHAPLATRILGLDVRVRIPVCVCRAGCDRGRGRLAKKSIRRCSLRL